MKLHAQFIPALPDLALPSTKQIEMKLIGREVLDKTVVFDVKLSAKW